MKLMHWLTTVEYSIATSYSNCIKLHLLYLNFDFYDVIREYVEVERLCCRFLSTADIPIPISL